MNTFVIYYTFWHTRTTKTQISMRICAVWSVFVVRIQKLCILGYPKCAQWRFWSDCANAQADLNLRWAHMSEGTFAYVAANMQITKNLDMPAHPCRPGQPEWSSSGHSYNNWNILNHMSDSNIPAQIFIWISIKPLRGAYAALQTMSIIWRVLVKPRLTFSSLYVVFVSKGKLNGFYL